MLLRAGVLCVCLAAGGVLDAFSQGNFTFRVISVTYNTSNPTQLAIDRGRIIWQETDLNSGNYVLKYYDGKEIITLDSNLLAVSAALEGDHIVWSTNLELAKMFDMRSMTTTPVGDSYNPDFVQPVSVSGDLAAFAVRKAGSGTNIQLHRFSTGTDTNLSAGTWNTAPSVQHGQVAWVVSDSEGGKASSNVYFFDGLKTTNLSATTGVLNRSPILRDGQIVWLQTVGGRSAVKLFTGDTVVTVAQSPGGNTIVSGYDESDGIAVASLLDTVALSGIMHIYNSETGGTTILADSQAITSVHISNGLVAWQSRTDANRMVAIYSVSTSLLQNIAAGERPIMDHDLIAWTYGDAVEFLRPVTYAQLTSDGMNGWEQTKFKTIDSNRVIWGNFANAVHMRLFSWDGSSTAQLSDSVGTRDLVMANDGYAVWRLDSDSLFYSDGTNPPVKFLDTIQAENPYVAGGSIGFFGPRLTVPDNIKHAWLYNIGSGTVTLLSSDSGITGNVLCDGNTACWLSGQTKRMMFYDGVSTAAISDSAAGYDYSYRGGKIAFLESRNGVLQVMLYDVASHTRQQLTTGGTDRGKPMTDGRTVVWFENLNQVATRVTGDLRYYDILSGSTTLVPNAKYLTTKWNWLSNGKIAWDQDGYLYVFDGSVLSQLTASEFNLNVDACLDRGNLVWRKTPNPPTESNGQVFAGKLQPHPSFDAADITGPVPLTVSFANRSWEGDIAYLWDFGDGTTSTAKSPMHTYLSPGKYSVTLTVSGSTGTVTERKYNLVRASSNTSMNNRSFTIPLQTELFQNYPNPFNPNTVVSFQLSVASKVAIVIYDILGREVATLVDEVKQPGEYRFNWDASGVASGVYCLTLRAGSYVQTRKLIHLK